MTDDEREYFNERAAIHEFDAGHTRAEAEQMAEADLIEYRAKQN